MEVRWVEEVKVCWGGVGGEFWGFLKGVRIG